jgi:high-affinity iron transporter
MYSAFTQTAVIAFREVLETCLVLGAIAGYLAIREQRWSRPVWAGALAGLLSSIVLGRMMQSLMIGFTSHLSAAALAASIGVTMLYLSGWLALGHCSGGWSHLVRPHLASAFRSSHQELWVAVLAFVVVFREGLELNLFVSVSTTSASWTFEHFSGLAIGLGAAVLMLWFVRRSASRFPLALAMMVTSACFYIFGLKFISDGVGELQHARLLSLTPLNADGSSLIETWEAAVVVALVVAFTLTTFLVAIKTRRAKAGSVQ